jgi:hypothetical protein
MDSRSENTHSDEFGRLEQLLRSERPEASALELDRIKLQAITQASRAGSRSGRLKGSGFGRSRRILSVALVIGMLGGGTVFAASGGLKSSSTAASAAKNQYCPPTSGSGGGPKGKSCGK